MHKNDLGTPRVEVSFVVFLFTSKLKRMEFSFVLWFLRMIAFLGFLLLFYFWSFFQSGRITSNVVLFDFSFNISCP